MPKRLTDTEKWKQAFFRGLQPAYKLLWLYINDDCDHCGIWTLDFEVAQIRVGLPVNKETALQQFKPEIIVMASGDEWFIPSQLDYKLSPSNPIHKKIIERLGLKGLTHEIAVNLPHLENAVIEAKNATGQPDTGLSTGHKKKEKEKQNGIKENNKASGEIQTELALWPTFDDFWNLYEKKADRADAEPVWKKLKQEEKEAIMLHIPDYKIQQPDKKFRKDPASYLRKRSWTNEIYPNYEQPKLASNNTRHEPFTADVSRTIQDKFASVAQRRRGTSQPSAQQGES